jgi:hypothetical protein
LQKYKLVSIGIDTGSINGAISVVDEDLKVLILTKVPIYQTEIKSHRNKSKLNKETGKFEKDYRKRSWVDFKAVGKLLEPYKNSKVIYTLEKATTRAMEGEASSFMNGNALGVFQGVSTLLHPIEYYEPLPITWKTDLGVTSDKQTSIELAEDLYQIRLKDYLPRGKVDDIAEALLLAFYGLRQYYNKKGEK